MKATVDPVILMFAFRYALGRMSMAPATVRAAIMVNIDSIPMDFRRQMIADIRHAVANNAAGMQFDADDWSAFADGLQRTIDRSLS